MTAQEVAQLIAQVGFPIVLIIAVVYYVGKFGIPKVVTLVETLVSDFREEMERERQFHGQQLGRLFDEQKSNTERIENKIGSTGDQVISEIRERCAK